MGSQEKLKKLAVVSGQLVEEKNYWTGKFAAPFEKSLFPPDYINPENRAGQLKTVKQTGIAGEHFSALMKLRNDSDIRLLMILASLVTLLLHKYSGHHDITLASPTLRQETQKDIEFINTVLVLRQHLTPEMSFKELLLQVRQDLMDSVEHQNYPMERLLYQLDLPIPTTGQYFPLCDAAVLLENIQTIDYLSSVNTGMCFSFLRGDSSLDLEITYDSSLYKSSTVSRIIHHLDTLMSRTLGEIGTPVSQLDIISRDEQTQILEHLDRGSAGYPTHLTLDAIFHRQVAETPGNIAVVLPASGEDGDDISLTYSQLDRRAGQLAAKLVQKGVAPETIVAILSDSPLDMVVAILATLKAGGAYMPIDTAFPADRVHFMLKDSATPLIMTTSALAGEFGLTNAPAPLDKLYIMDIEQEATGPDNESLESESPDSEPFTSPVPASPHSPAYVIYTSGTTGRPKGVIVEHRNVVRLFFHDQCFFDFNSDDVWTLFHSFCFDFSVWEMYGPLLHGGKLVLVDKLTARSPEGFLQLLKDQQVTILNQTPAAFYNLAEHALAEPPELRLRYIIFGGEALSPSRLKTWHKNYPAVKLINMFGITETTVHVTFKELTQEDLDLGVSNIGVPIPTLGAYATDDHLTPRPIGVIGELCVSGAGVARGYLNRPLLTAEKFPENPLHPGQTLYRSGDLGKLNEHLELEYLGRGDHQVKVRGYRIEPGEIQRQLLSHKDVREAVVMLTSAAGTTGASGDGGSYLCAYVVCDSPLTLADMKDHLSQSLPDYMVPSFVVNLEKMPLTPNGKIDRKRLPLPEAGLRTGYSAPQTRCQKDLTAIWAEVLDLEAGTIGIDHNFFDLGGHSLKATSMALEVQKSMKIKLPMAEIFSTPTIRELSSYLENAMEEDFSELKPAEPREYYELSSAQQRFYTIYNMYPDNTAYNIPQLVPLPAGYGKQAAEDALKELINRHESLRTSFRIIDGQPLQTIHQAVDFSLETLRATAEPNTTAMNEMIGDFVAPFRLDEPPLIRAALMDMGTHPDVLMVDMHHIITDGVSNDILVEEFYELLRGHALPPVTYQYRDFSSWEHSPERRQVLARQRDFWLRHLQGKLPRLELPMDIEGRSQDGVFTGDSIRFTIEGEQYAALKQLETSCNTSVFTILLSVYYILMARLSGQEDIIVGTAAAGRTHADLMRIVGLFFNTLALRTRPRQELTFTQYLEQVEEVSREALENQDYPFDMLVQDLAGRGALERRSSRNPLFNTMFSLHNFGSQLQHRSGPEESAPQYDPFAYQGDSAKFDLLLNVVQYPQIIHFVLDYSTALFKPSTAGEISRNFTWILDQVIKEPGQFLRDISLDGQLAQRAARHLLDKEENKVRDYWLEKLADDPPKGGFPFDRRATGTGQTIQTTRTPRQFPFTFNPQLAEKLGKISNQSDIRLYIILLSGVAALLEKYTGLPDILMGGPIERQEKVGHFINTLLIFRIQPEDRLTFKELLMQVSKTMASAVENVNYPFETLLYNLGIHYEPDDDFPLFDVTVLLENLHDPGYIENIHTNTAFHFRHENGNTGGVIRYNGQHYGEDAIQRIAGHLERLLESGLNALDAPMASLQWLSDREEQQLTHDFNAHTAKPVGGTDIPGAFLRQVEENPEIPAVVAGNGQLTYAQLAQRSGALAARLRESGIGDGSVVGLLTGRDIEMIVGIMAILQAGAAYMPINADYPAGRIRFMLEDSRAGAVLTTASMDSDTWRDSVPDACKVLLMDASSSPSAIDGDGWNHNPKPHRPAYVIYTSGSTGNPKGVVVEHRNVLNLVAGLQERVYHSYGGPLKVALVAPYIFDASVQQIFAALLLGHSLYIVPEDARTDGGALSDYLARNQVEICDGTPSHLRLMLESPDTPLKQVAVKHYIIGGETLPLALVERFVNVFPDVAISNVYGPTECCVDSTSYRISADNLPDYPFVPIGKPMPGESVYIVDRNLRLKPVGAVGELCIGGDGVSRGYLNRAGLSRERFADSPFGEGRLYRTGDLARWLPDGNIQFQGRMDNQIQIRGFRIETGEIENQLLAHQDIDQALVMVRSWNTGSAGEANGNAGDEDIYLCAYYLSKRILDPSDLKNHLATKLPEHMIPSFFVQLDVFPLTVNGKIDRKQLPAPQSDTGVRCVPPETPLQEELLDIWSEVLGMDKQLIGIDRDFFEIGGHSLKSTILISRMQRQLKVDVPIAEIFSNSTIRRLSAFIQQTRKKQFIPIPPVKQQDYYLLSSAQKRLYILHQLDPASTGYNAPIAVELGGGLDMDRLERAFTGLIQRHESLRTSFHLQEDQPVQQIHDADRVSLHIQRLEAPGEEGIPEVLAGMVRPFDLTRPPLMRAGLVTTVTTENHRTVLMVDMHHIISDGVSEEILLPEFLALYNGEKLPPLTIQYKDFAHWQHSEAVREDIKNSEIYWLEQFSGDIPVINLPTDFPRPQMQSFEGDGVRFQWDRSRMTRLNQLAAKEDVTLYMLLMAIFNTFLAKISGQEEIVVGSPVAGRGHADLRQIIGMFVNTLALKHSPLGDKPFSQLLREVKQQVLEGLEHQDYPFEDLVEKLSLRRDTSRNPLFDVMLTMQNFAVDPEDLNLDHLDHLDPNKESLSEGNGNASGLKMSLYPAAQVLRTSKFDLTLSVLDVGDELSLRFEYCTRLFKKSGIQRFIQYLSHLTDEICDLPDAPLSQFHLVGENQKQHILYHFNETETRPVQRRTVLELIRHRAEEQPGSPALISEEGTMNYEEWFQRSSRLAGQLQSRGVEPGVIVAVMADRSVDMMVGILAILIAGGAYLPIDTGTPASRAAFMLADSNAPLLLALPQTGAEDVVAEAPGTTWLNLADESLYIGEPIDSAASPQNPAYVIYTSGSTGKPKGVMVAHYSLFNRLEWMQEKYPLNSEDVLIQKTPYTFDVSLWELFWWAMYGASLCLAAPGEEKDPEALLTRIHKHKVTVIHFVPSMLNVFLQYIDRFPATGENLPLKQVICSGEALTPHHLEQFNRLMGPKPQLINLYGPTEATVDVSYYDCPKQQLPDIIPIGKPIRNIRLYILNKHRRLQPVGIPGELAIAGEGVAMGYLNNPGLSAEKFVDNPFAEGVMYLTGDLTRWLEDGNIQFLGRFDHQVKIRGVRIELEEIRRTLLSHDSVAETVVLDHTDQGGEKYLCAYYVPSPASGSGDGPGRDELRRFLAQSLPSVMLPAHFIRMDEMPRTSSGKIDLKALPRVSEAEETDHVPPQNQLQDTLAGLWADILGTAGQVIGIHDNFFRVGGNSLKATLLVLAIHRTMGLKVPLAELFKTPTIEGLYRYVQNARQTDPTGVYATDFTSLQPAEDREYYPLSAVQGRFFAIHQTDPEGTAYNIPQSIVFNEPIDADTLENTFRELIRGHESLRTSFHLVAGEPVQMIHHDVDFRLETRDPDDGDLIDSIRDFSRPFDLLRAPLVRARLISPSSHRILLVDMHHIITDGVSGSILKRDFFALYRGETLPPLPYQYKDYAVWQTRADWKDKMDRQEGFWLKFFEEPPLPLELPLDYKRGSKRGMEGASYPFEIDRHRTEELTKRMEESDTTLFMYLFAVYNILLSKLCGREDIVVGTAAAARTHADLSGIIGLFFNTLAIRTLPQREKPFDRFLEEIKHLTLDAFENQDYPFDRLVDTLTEKAVIRPEMNRNPLFDTMFALHNHDPYARPKLESHIVSALPGELNHQNGNGAAKFDLLFNAAEQNRGVKIYLDYSTALFKPETIENIAKSYLDILDQVLADPGVMVKNINLSGQTEDATFEVEQSDYNDFQF